MADPDPPDSLPTQAWTGPGEMPPAAPAPETRPPPPSSARRGGWEPPEPAELQASFSQYEIRAILGRGGMGAVYQGWQRRLQRLVAIKILPAGLEDAGGNFAERFQREAQALARLSHPGIVSVYDAGETAEGLFYFVMEYIEGTDVQQMVKTQGALPPEHALAITAHVCDALAYAHKRGVIHRDIKPANIMVDREGQVKVADFGLAKVATEDSGALLTGSHIQMGTPDFMAPEASFGMGAVDHRADLYAVGVMLYQMLTGEVPRGLFDMPSVHKPGLDVRFDAIVARAMQKNPDKRYASATELRTDLDKIFTEIVPHRSAAQQQPPPSPPPQAAVHEESPAKASAPKATPAVMKAIAPGGGAKKSKLPLYVILTAIILALVGGAIFWAEQPKPAGGRRSVTAQTSVGESRGKVGDDKASPSASEEIEPLKASIPPPTVAATPAAATKDAPFVNTLGQEFVPVPGTQVLFCRWETRVKDYAAFARANKVDDAWTKQEKDGVPVSRDPEHPAGGTTWEDANAFCRWLTDKERAAGKLPARMKYRLPTDEEWSRAVGLREETGATPKERSLKNDVTYPWGTSYPPPANVGNYADAAWHEKFPKEQWIEGYRDGYATTSPVGSFPPNEYGLYDMGGNVWEWCEDWDEPGSGGRVMRGASWRTYGVGPLVSSVRIRDRPDSRSNPDRGFRIVLAPEVATAANAAATQIPATPSPATPKPLTEVEKWLAQVDGPQQEAFQKQVVKPFEAGVAELRARYLASLDAGIVKASAAGQLAEALAWRTERQAFEKAQNVAAEDAAGLPAGLQALRAGYRKQLARLEQDRAAQAKILHAQYDVILAQNQTLLTQRQRLDDALLLQQKRDELARIWLAGSGLVAPTASAPAPPTSAPAASQPIARASSEAGDASAPEDSARWKNAINLLALVDLRQHVLGGTWERRDDGLVSDTHSRARIEFPYQPSAEYDFRISFTRLSGREGIHQMVCQGSHAFEWFMGVSMNKMGFMVLSASGDALSNRTVVRRDNVATQGRRYTSTVAVRAHRVAAYVDGALVQDYRTDFTEMQGPYPGLALRDPSRLGIGTVESSVVFHSAEVLELREGVTFGKHRYRFIPSAVSWPEAKAQAEALGGHLATITSVGEWAAAERALSGKKSAWLGAEVQPGGAWKWLNGEPWQFTRWKQAPAEPITKHLWLRAFPGDKGWQWETIFEASDQAQMAAGIRDYIGGFLVEWDQ